MKKNNHNKNILQSFSLLLIGLVLAGFIFGGLSIYKLQKQNLNLNTKQNALENKIISLESQIIDGQNKVAQISSDMEKVSGDLAKNKKDLAYYRELALAPKEILGVSDTNSPVEPIVDIKPAIQTVTKTATKKVYIKEKPKYEASVVIEGVGKYKVNVQAGDTAYTALKNASVQNNFALKTTDWGGDLGISIDGIGGVNPTPDEHKYWAFYYNNNFSNVGVSNQPVTTDDIIYFVLSSW